jgi:hypothetical protein
LGFKNIKTLQKLFFVHTHTKRREGGCD